MRARLLCTFLSAAVACWADQAVPDFHLPDVNPHSPRHGAVVSPRDYLLQVSAYYFGEAGCGYCRGQFGYLQQMQKELKAASPDINIEIVGINIPNDAQDNPAAISGQTLAWLQDSLDATQSAWTNWQVTWRDVRIIDPSNKLIAVYNLTEHDLLNPTNYLALKRTFLQAAQAVDADGDHLPDYWELHYFGNLNAAPGEDADGDGFDNFTEFAFGTDPTDPNSHPNFSPAVMSTGQPELITVSFRRQAGAVLDYFVESSTDLSHWVYDPNQIQTLQGATAMYDGKGTAAASYGLVMEPQPWGYLRIRALPRAVPGP